MKYQIIAFHDAYLDAYQPPIFVKESKDDIQEVYRRSIMSNPDEAYKNRCHELEVVHFGTFNDMDGTIELTDKVKLFDMASLFPRGYLAAKKGGPSA